MKIKAFLMILWIFWVSDIWAQQNTSLGERAFARGSYDTALDYFTKAIEAKEPTGKAHFFTGQILENRKKFRESIPFYAVAVERGLPNDLRKAALWKLVILNERAGDWERTLAYVERLEQMGVRHTNLAKTRQRAETFLTPEKRRARNLIIEAHDLEENNKENFKTPGFYKREPGILRNIISKYREAISLDGVYENYRWKIAHYYEKLQDWRSALKEYEILAGTEKGKARAFYKAGIMHRRLGAFNESSNLLKEVLLLPGNDINLTYFTELNLAQSRLGESDFSESIVYAKKAVQSSRKIKSRDSDSAMLTYCLGLYATDSTGKEKACKSILNQPATSFSGWRKSAYLILQGFEKIQDKKNPQAALKYWHTSLLPPDNSESISEEETEDDEDQNEAWQAPPLWMRSVVPKVAKAYAGLQSSEGLYLILKLYSKNVKSDPQYHYWYAKSAFAANRFSEAVSSFRKVEQLDKNDEREFWISLARSGYHSELESAFNRHLKKGFDKKEYIRFFTWLEADESFRAFRGRTDYLPFKEQYLPSEKAEPQGPEVPEQVPVKGQ
ncbi:MAG: tetratricopeptide repeat protein [Leptospiraceae bacterium]|nr:tetratricopeptide repeat protein [Leptospiraceae bacterium]